MFFFELELSIFEAPEKYISTRRNRSPRELPKSLTLKTDVFYFYFILMSNLAVRKLNEYNHYNCEERLNTTRKELHSKNITVSNKLNQSDKILGRNQYQQIFPLSHLLQLLVSNLMQTDISLQFSENLIQSIITTK